VFELGREKDKENIKHGNKNPLCVSIGQLSTCSELHNVLGNFQKVLDSQHQGVSSSLDKL
jgi:hypothetical protein